MKIFFVPISLVASEFTLKKKDSGSKSTLRIR